MVKREFIKFIRIPPKKDIIGEIIDGCCYIHQQTKSEIRNGFDWFSSKTSLAGQKF